MFIARNLRELGVVDLDCFPGVATADSRLELKWLSLLLSRSMLLFANIHKIAQGEKNKKNK